MSTFDPTLRYGYKPGTCGAWTKAKTPCKRYPLHGHERCRRHGAGWNTGMRKHPEPKPVEPKIVDKRLRIKRKFNAVAKRPFKPKGPTMDPRYASLWDRKKR